MLVIRALALLALSYLSGVAANPIPNAGTLEPDEGGYLYQCAADPKQC